jgi:hypothetical protein
MRTRNGRNRGYRARHADQASGRGVRRCRVGRRKRVLGRVARQKLNRWIRDRRIRDWRAGGFDAALMPNPRGPRTLGPPPPSPPGQAPQRQPTPAQRPPRRGSPPRVVGRPDLTRSPARATSGFGLHCATDAACCQVFIDDSPNQLGRWRHTWVSRRNARSGRRAAEHLMPLRRVYWRAQRRGTSRARQPGSESRQISTTALRPMRGPWRLTRRNQPHRRNHGQ